MSRARARAWARAWGGLVVWGALALLVAAAVGWRARDLRSGMEQEVERNYAVTGRALLVTLTAWAQTRAAHAQAMAALLDGDPAFAATADAARRERLHGRVTHALTALARRETFVGGWVLDAGGRVLAGRVLDGRVAGDAPGGAEVAAALGHAPRARAGAPRDAAAGTPERDAPDPGAVRALTVPCGRRSCVAFRAPVRAAAASGGRTVGAVVLLAMVDDSTFRPLNPMRPHVRTGRTSLLAPLGRLGAPGGGPVSGPSDTLVVVASVGAPESPRPAPRQATRAAPAHVRQALATPPGALATGRAPGLHGRPTHYAVGRVPVLDWIVLRELDRDEILAAVRGALLVEEPILVTLLVSLVALARNRLRAGRVRRDQELVRLRADFVASTSHELRTPLAQIRMFAELLQNGALRGPEESARALRIIEKEASRLTILVDNLLNYTRLRRHADGVPALATVPPTHVADDVQQVIEAFAPLAAERGARVVSCVPRGLMARVDSLALRQVLINFLENAVKYGPAGQTVSVGATADARCVRVWVDDQGDGVPRDEREAVWTAFRRGARAEASAQGGSGIGLAVVRELALRYGGGVAVGDAPGGGARFVAEFPRADGAPLPA